MPFCPNSWPISTAALRSPRRSPRPAGAPPPPPPPPAPAAPSLGSGLQSAPRHQSRLHRAMGMTFSRCSTHDISIDQRQTAGRRPWQNGAMSPNPAPSAPAFLYGTAWKEDRTPALVELALRTGFRGIDTANQRRHYFEAGVGQGLAPAYPAGVVTRDDPFLQTQFTYQPAQDP